MRRWRWSLALLAPLAAVHASESAAVPTYSADEFRDLWDLPPTPTATVYATVPLSDLQPVTRGALITDLARELDTRVYPEAAMEDPVTVSSPGKRRMTDYDWLRDGRKISVSSAQLRYISTAGWIVVFQHVKLPLAGVRERAPFDELYLALYTPEGIYFYLHDLRFGVTNASNNTAMLGHQISIASSLQAQGGGRTRRGSGPASTEWRDSLEMILYKLDKSNCTRLGFLGWDDPSFVSIAAAHPGGNTSDAFRNVPLADLSGPRRGWILTQLARAVDARLNPRAKMEGVAVEDRNRRGNSKYDWRRDGTRVALKSAQLTWTKTGHKWRFAYCNVKLARGAESWRADAKAYYEELQLAMYTPRGIYLFRHDMRLHMTSQGALTESMGHQIVFNGPAKERDWSVALDRILSNIGSKIPAIAAVTWAAEGEGGGSDPQPNPQRRRMRARVGAPERRRGLHEHELARPSGVAMPGVAMPTWPPLSAVRRSALPQSPGARRRLRAAAATVEIRPSLCDDAELLAECDAHTAGGFADTADGATADADTADAYTGGAYTGGASADESLVASCARAAASAEGTAARSAGGGATAGGGSIPGSTAVASRPGATGTSASSGWISEWRRRIDAWWLALPAGLASNLQMCAAFFSGALLSRFEIWRRIQRGIVEGGLSEGRALSAPPPTGEDWRTRALHAHCTRVLSDARAFTPCPCMRSQVFFGEFFVRAPVFPRLPGFPVSLFYAQWLVARRGRQVV